MTSKAEAVLRDIRDALGGEKYFEIGERVRARYGHTAIMVGHVLRREWSCGGPHRKIARVRLSFDSWERDGRMWVPPDDWYCVDDVEHLP